MKDSQDKSASLDNLLDRIHQLEKRVSILEEDTDIPRTQVSKGSPDSNQYASEAISSPPSRDSEKETLESKIGEYGMAWLGNIILLVGILFISQLMLKNGHEVLSLVFNFVSVAGIYTTAHFTRRAVPHMSRLFNYNGHVLLFIATMEIYLIPATRITEIAGIGYVAVILVIVSLTYLAYRQKSQILVILVWIMALLAAVASNSTHFMLPLMLGLAGSSFFFLTRYGWWSVLNISIIIVYSTFLIWIFGNPIMNKSFEIISDPQFGYIYLFAIALLYTFMALLPKSEKVLPHLLNTSIVLNGLGFSFIMTISTLAFFTTNFQLYFGLIAAFCIGYSIWLQSRGNWKLIAPLYAIYSFVALSITIGGVYKFPLAFFLLSIQSLLVVSMALWFRSRFIVIMNSLLFIGLLIAFLAFGDHLNSINFSFAIVALVTARILNWKKTRLEIKTEIIRNIYLFTGATMVLYSLHHSVPTQFTTLSWALAAVVFFVLSVLIHNIKYRWLAILTMVVTVFYLFIVDLKNISLGYRIVALMFIAVISLGISIFYTRKIRHKKEDRDQSFVSDQ